MFDRRVRPSLGFDSLDALRHYPNEAHARAASALAITAQRIADKHGCLRRPAKRLERHVKNRWVGLLGANAVAVDQSCKKRRQTNTVTYGFEITIKIRHDAKAIALPQCLQNRPIACESGRCL